MKGSFDSFHDTGLERYLRETGITDVVVCGLVTSVCVLFSTQSAFARGFRVRLYESGCGDRTREKHDSTIKMYGNYCFEVYNNIDTLFLPHNPALTIG